MEGKKIYLDYNATTPLETSVVQAITGALTDAWGNPSSSYHEGVYAKDIINDSRSAIAEMVGATSNDIIFTSGGTEGNNLILQTALKHRSKVLANQSGANEKPHFVTSNIEHDSIKLVLEAFEENGHADVTYVKAAKSSGRVEVNDIVSAVRPTTCMVTVMMANNETGVIQPVREISQAIREKFNHGGRKILIHTDAAQTIGKIKVNVTELGVDYLTIVGHKFYGPRIGALYVRGVGSKDSVPFYPMFYGGGQERNFRPGTENTAMIAGLGEAARLVNTNLTSYADQMRTARDFLESRLSETFLGGEGTTVHFNGRLEASDRLPNTSNFSIVCADVKDLTGRCLLFRCNGFVASVGAACHSHAGNTRGSPILLAIGVPENVARSAIRMSVGRTTTKDDIESVVSDLFNALQDLRKLSS